MPGEASASATLARIRDAGILRVGTTGDYTPFSLKRPDGTYEGSDIDMAHDLAATLGVPLGFRADRVGRSARRFSRRQLRHRDGRRHGQRGARRPRLFLDPDLYRRQAPAVPHPKTATASRPWKRSTSPGCASSPIRVRPTRHSPAPIQARPGHDPPRQRQRVSRNRRRPCRCHGDGRARSRPSGGAASRIMRGAGRRPVTRLEKAYMFARDKAMKAFIDDWLGARIAGGAWRLALDRARWRIPPAPSSDSVRARSRSIVSC